MLAKWLTHDFKLPNTLRCSWRDVLKIILFILLPNIVLDLLAFGLNIARPLINWDYGIASIIMLVASPWAKSLAVLLFLFCLVFDIVMLVMQIFPFMDFAAITYLAPFLPNAPTRYILALVAGVLYAVIMPVLLWKLSKRVPQGTAFIMYMMLLVVGHNLSFAKYVDDSRQYSRLFGMGNFYYSSSQILLFKDQADAGFFQAAQEVPDLIPSEFDAASQRFKQPQSDKLLLIVAESWGYPAKPELQRDSLQKIYDKQDKLEFVEDGKLRTVSSTVQGELRELCRLNTKGGYALRAVPNEKFANCLPNQLKAQGYQTFGMHGASSLLYDRNSWYEKAGMTNTLFPEKMPTEKRCYAFNGICDSELFSQVSKAFATNPNGKTFFYWLTLTSHLPYATDDMHNPRLDCVKHQLPDGDICNNLRLVTQYFDDLAKLIDDPAMKGVEVIVVGDHMPPIMGSSKPVQDYLMWTNVSWLHFKIK